MEKKAIEQNGRVSKMAVKKALKTQVGGSHYRRFSPQPIEFFWDFQIPFCYANAMKYVLRYKWKNGVEDLRKAKHCLEYAIERERVDFNSKNCPFRSFNSLKIKDVDDFITKNENELNVFQCNVLNMLAGFSEKGEVRYLYDAKNFIAEQIYRIEILGEKEPVNVLRTKI